MWCWWLHKLTLFSSFGMFFFLCLNSSQDLLPSYLCCVTISVCHLNAMALFPSLFKQSVMGVISASTMALTFISDILSTEISFLQEVMMFPQSPVLCLPTEDISDPSSDTELQQPQVHLHYIYSVFVEEQCLDFVHLTEYCVNNLGKAFNVEGRRLNIELWQKKKAFASKSLLFSEMPLSG